MLDGQRVGVAANQFKQDNRGTWATTTTTAQDTEAQNIGAVNAKRAATEQPQAGGKRSTTHRVSGDNPIVSRD